MDAAAAAPDSGGGGGGGGHVRSQSGPVILSGGPQPIRAPEGLLRRSISVDSFDFYYREMGVREAAMESACRLIAHIIQRRREGRPRYTDFQFNRPHHFDDVSQDDIEEDADGGVPDAAPAA